MFNVKKSSIELLISQGFIALLAREQLYVDETVVPNANKDRTKISFKNIEKPVCFNWNLPIIIIIADRFFPRTNRSWCSAIRQNKDKINIYLIIVQENT